MMLGARTAAWAKSGGGVPTARDYVQDGLIAMWDGIENAGWGVHNQNERSIWVDLVGGHNMVIKGAVPDSVFTENAFHNNNLKFGTICKDKITYGATAITVEASAFLSENDTDALILQNRSGNEHNMGFSFFRFEIKKLYSAAILSDN